jgi:hypothetical protein
VSPRMGRPPSNNPKSEAVHVRLDKECLDILNAYCSTYNVARTEAIRQGIKKLCEDIKK